MTPASTLTSQQQLIDTAKAPLLGFNEKDWDAVRGSMTPGFVYDEVPTGRRAEGVEEVVTLWQGWAEAFPDARATIDKELAAGDTVVVEITWRGTHKGALQTPAGPIPATGKRIEIRACCVCDMGDGRVRLERHYFDMGTLLHQIGIS